MLDLVQLSPQVAALSREWQQESQQRHHRLQQLLNVYTRWLGDPDAWVMPPEPPPFAWARPQGIPAIQNLPPAPDAHRVMATDGSQLVMNHHESVACWLLNVGLVRLTYGTGERPLLRTFPQLFSHRSRWSAGMDPETALAWQRSLWELQVLAQAALEATPPLPQIALVDGSLLAWGLERLPQESQREQLQPWLATAAQLQAAGIPLLGYISAPRSSEVVGFLRLGLGEGGAGGRGGQGAVGEPQPRTDPLGGLQDRHLWGAVLQMGQASPVWQSGSRLNALYGDQSIHGCYLHGGTEIVRVEFPAWVAQDPDCLKLSLGIILAQVSKGRGYPVSLAEAHHLAVVKGSDRQRFLAMVERELIRSGMEQVQVSPKQARKRQSMV